MPSTDGCSVSNVGGGSGTTPCATGGSGTGGSMSIATGNVQLIANGDLSTCALLNNNTVKCWGLNSKGQLGDGTTTNRSTPTLVSGISNATKLGTSGWHTCAILSDTTIKCWGQNDYQQLGSAAGANSSVPVVVPSVSNAIGLALGGGGHTCALISDGSIKCWGRCAEQQCGASASSINTPPTTVSGVTGATAISAYDNHTCALMNDSTVKCWGEIDLLITSVPATHQGPTTVVNAAQQPLTGITMIDSGKNFDLAANSSTLYAWGTNNNGSLGDGTFTGRLTAAPVLNVTNPISISGGYITACAASQGGTVKCWGNNFDGEAGNNPVTSANVINSPLSVPMSSVTQIAVGESTTCALTLFGSVYCWGSNAFGGLGNGSSTGSYTPVLATGL